MDDFLEIVFELFMEIISEGADSKSKPVRIVCRVIMALFVTAVVGFLLYVTIFVYKNSRTWGIILTTIYVAVVVSVVIYKLKKR